MKLDRLFAPFMQAPLFSDLTPGQLKLLALGCERVQFADGEALITAGSTSDAAFLVLEGTVARIEHPLGPVGDEDFGPGTLVGEMAMLVETEHTSTVVARGKVDVVVLSRDRLHTLIERDPSLGDYFAERLMARVDDLIGGLNQLAGLLRLNPATAAEPAIDRMQ